MFFPPVDSDWLETTMQTRNAALIALAGFGLGVFAGKGLGVFGTDGTTDAPEPAAEMASVPAGHPRVAERGLGDVVTTTLQMRTAPAANASATMPSATSRAGTTDLIAQADDLRLLVRH